MNPYQATEQAYKNGYEAGVKEFAEKMKKVNGTKLVLWDEDIDRVANELMK